LLFSGNETVWLNTKQEYINYYYLFSSAFVKSIPGRRVFTLALCSKLNF